MGRNMTVCQSEINFIRMKHALVLTAYPDERDGRCTCMYYNGVCMGRWMYASTWMDRMNVDR